MAFRAAGGAETCSIELRQQKTVRVFPMVPWTAIVQGKTLRPGREWLQ